MSRSEKAPVSALKRFVGRVIVSALGIMIIGLDFVRGLKWWIGRLVYE